MSWHPWGQAALVALVIIAVIVNVVLVHREVGRHDEHEDGIAQLWKQRDEDVIAEFKARDAASSRIASLERWKADIEAAIAEYMDVVPSTGRHAHKEETAQ